MKRFFYHYNRPLSNKLKKPTVSLHFDKTCHYIDPALFHILVPTKGKINKKQPYFVMQRYCNKITFFEGHTTII